ncbi:hypothetical protein DB34_13070 [Acetobacter pasteurianus]|nr:hypothetical protein DB34_13070 [Acetobacter pasteurianus]
MQRRIHSCLPDEQFCMTSDFECGMVFGGGGVAFAIVVFVLIDGVLREHSSFWRNIRGDQEPP